MKLYRLNMINMLGSYLSKRRKGMIKLYRLIYFNLSKGLELRCGKEGR